MRHWAARGSRKERLACFPVDISSPCGCSPQGLAVEGGRVYIVTDNDGVDENYGETVFLDLGTVAEALGVD